MRGCEAGGVRDRGCSHTHHFIWQRANTERQSKHRAKTSSANHGGEQLSALKVSGVLLRRGPSEQRNDGRGGERSRQ